MNKLFFITAMIAMIALAGAATVVYMDSAVDAPVAVHAIGGTALLCDAGDPLCGPENQDTCTSCTPGCHCP